MIESGVVPSYNDPERTRAAARQIIQKRQIVGGPTAEKTDPAQIEAARRTQLQGMAFNALLRSGVAGVFVFATSLATNDPETLAKAALLGAGIESIAGPVTTTVKGLKATPNSTSAPATPPNPALPTASAPSPVPSTGAARTLIGTSEAQFRRDAARTIASTPNHILTFLLDSNGQFHPTRGLKHSELADRPDLVQMGHMQSKKAGGTRIILQGAWENQFNNVTVEHRRNRGAFVETNPAIDVGGIAVDLQTAKLWQKEGLIPTGTVANATRIP